MLTLGVRSLTRISRTSKPKAATRPRNYASFEEEPKPSAAQVDPIFNRPASSAGDSQTLPLVEKARALLESRKSGTFTSVSLAGEDKHMPLFGSVMPYIMMKGYPGQPIIALRTDEKHYKHIQAGERASLVIFPLVPRHLSPKELPLPKLNITADCQAIVEPEAIEAILNKYDVVHPGSVKFLKDRSLFHFYALKPKDVFYVLSTQEIDQFRGAAFMDAAVDPIARDSRELLDDMNKNYAQELKLLCKEYGDIDVSQAILFAADRLGFDILGLVAGEENQWHEFRMPLDRSVEDIEEFRGFVEQACKDVRKVAYKKTIISDKL